LRDGQALLWLPAPMHPTVAARRARILVVLARLAAFARPVDPEMAELLSALVRVLGEDEYGRRTEVVRQPSQRAQRPG
jgi:hypothetical protein